MCRCSCLSPAPREPCLPRTWLKCREESWHIPFGSPSKPKPSLSIHSPVDCVQPWGCDREPTTCSPAPSSVLQVLPLPAYSTSPPGHLPSISKQNSLFFHPQTGIPPLLCISVFNTNTRSVAYATNRGAALRSAFSPCVQSSSTSSQPYLQNHPRPVYLPPLPPSFLPKPCQLWPRQLSQPPTLPSPTPIHFIIHLQEQENMFNFMRSYSSQMKMASSRDFPPHFEHNPRPRRGSRAPCALAPAPWSLAGPSTHTPKAWPVRVLLPGALHPDTFSSLFSQFTHILAQVPRHTEALLSLEHLLSLRPLPTFIFSFSLHLCQTDQTACPGRTLCILDPGT